MEYLLAAFAVILVVWGGTALFYKIRDRNKYTSSMSGNFYYTPEEDRIIREMREKRNARIDN